MIVHHYENSFDRSRKRRVSAKKSGAILVFVLLLLALCSAVIICSHSLVTRSVLRAAHAEKEVQNRWAIVSLRRSLLMRSDALLEVPIDPTQIARDERDGLKKASSMRLASSRINLVLAGSRYVAIVDDENAKLPLNRLHASKRFELWRSEVRNLIGDAVTLNKSLPARRLLRWGDLFQLHSSQDGNLVPAVRGDPAFEQLTLVSNGTVNCRNVPIAVLNAIWRIFHGHSAPDCVIALRQFQGPLDIGQYCRSHGLPEREASFASEILSPTSRCASITIHHYLPGGGVATSRFYYRTQQGFADDHFGDLYW